MISISILQNNLTMVYTIDITIYFSYQQLVAFERAGKLYIARNEWSRTTAKHLARIKRGYNSDRIKELPYEEIEEYYKSFYNHKIIKCPKCGSYNYTSDGLGQKDEEFEMVITCDNCKYKYKNHYKLCLTNREEL